MNYLIPVSVEQDLVEGDDENDWRSHMGRPGQKRAMRTEDVVLKFTRPD